MKSKPDHRSENKTETTLLHDITPTDYNLIGIADCDQMTRTNGFMSTRIDAMEIMIGMIYARTQHV